MGWEIGMDGGTQRSKLANGVLTAGNRRGGSAGNKLKMTLGLPVYVS